MFAVAVFDRNEDGELLQTFGPLRQRSPHHAIWLAKQLAKEHDGVIAGRANPTRPLAVTARRRGSSSAAMYLT